MFAFEPFTGKSKTHRLNLVSDHVADRQQALAQVRQAREERERQNRLRKARQVLCRSAKQFLARLELHRRAVARTLAVADERTTCRSTEVLLSGLSASRFVNFQRPDGQHALRAVLRSVVDMTDFDREHVAASRPALLGLLRSLEHGIPEGCFSPTLLEDEAGCQSTCTERLATQLESLVALSSTESDQSLWIHYLLAQTRRHNCNQSEKLVLQPSQVQRLLESTLRRCTVALLGPSGIATLLTQSISFNDSPTSNGTPGGWADDVLWCLVAGGGSAPARVSLPSNAAVDDEDTLRRRSESVAQVVSASAAHVEELAASPMLSLRRLLAMCGLISFSDGGQLFVSYVKTVTRLVEAASLQFESYALSCSDFLDRIRASWLFDDHGGFYLFRTASSFPGEQRGQFVLLASQVLCTPFLLTSLFGSDSDRQRLIPNQSKAIAARDIFRSLTNVFLLNSCSDIPTHGSAAPALWQAVQDSRFAVAAEGVPLLFLSLYEYYVDSGIFVRDLHNARAATETTARMAVRKLRDIAVLAHLYGCQDAASELVATKVCTLLAKVFVVDELEGFCGTQDWLCSVAFNAREVSDEWQQSLLEDEERAEDMSDAPTSFLELASRRSRLMHHNRGNYFVTSKTWKSAKRFVMMLRNVPFLLRFDTRVQVFSSLLRRNTDPRRFFAGQRLTVRRGAVFEDAYQAFGFRGSLAGVDISPHFRNEVGDEEGAGQGVYRDFVLCLCKEGFSPEFGLFRKTDSGLLYPSNLSREATQDEHHLNRFRFLGNVVGKALQDGILLDVPFAPHFRNALLGRRNTFHHLTQVDAVLAHNLALIRDMGAEVETLGLTFTATTDVFGTAVEFELIPNGAQQSVTRDNVSMYVLYYADYKLNRESEAQSRAFQHGLHEIVESTALQIFGCNELDLLFQGSESSTGLDVDDWEQSTSYNPPTGKDEPVIAYFWRSVRRMTPEQQRSLLKFVTSTGRAPLLGFQYMVPRFTICVTDSPHDFLPSSATCFCLLKLPRYRSEDETFAKLTAAISHGTTFEMT